MTNEEQVEPPVDEEAATDESMSKLLEGGLSVEEMFDAMGQEIIANGLYLSEKVKSGKKVTKQEENEQQERIKRFKEIEMVLTKLKKNNRISAGDNSKFTKDLLDKIKAKKSSVGAIVAKKKEA